MKFIVTKIILIFFIYLCSPILSSAQEISAILNALQERNTKVEELRELNFNQWKGLYADWQKISGASTPGEGDWLAEIIGFQKSSNKRYEEAERMGTEAERQLVFSEMEGKYKPIDLEYTLITGGADNVAGYTSGSAHEGGDPEYFFVQDYDIPAHHIYLQFEEILIKAGAPEKPKAEDIEQDPLAVNKWAYKLLVWVGTHLKGLEYTKKEIKWSALAQSQVSESNINSLDSVELQTTLIEASLHFDRLKTHFFNVKKRTDNQNVPEKYASIENYTELSSPSFGAIKIADLKFFSYAVSQLHTLRHPIIVNSQKGARGKVYYGYESYLLPKGEDEISSLEFAETGSGSDNMLVEPLYLNHPYDRLIGGQFSDPRVKTHFVLSSYASLGILSELEIIATGTSYPVWRVEAVSSGEVSIYTSIDCETQTCPYKPFEMYVGWKKLDYTSSEQADYRNGRFSSGDLGENSGYRSGWFTSKTLALWTPAFDNTGLDQWENLVIASPTLAGLWDVPAVGPYKFVLSLGQGNDLRSSGAIVINTDKCKLYSKAVDMAFVDALEFIGSPDEFEVTYDYSVSPYPQTLQSILDADNGLNHYDYYRAWNKPRIKQIKGKDMLLDVDYVQDENLHIKLTLKYIGSNGAVGDTMNIIDIYNDSTKTDVTALSGDGIRTWVIKESKGSKRICKLKKNHKSKLDWIIKWYDLDDVLNERFIVTAGVVPSEVNIEHYRKSMGITFTSFYDYRKNADEPQNIILTAITNLENPNNQIKVENIYNNIELPNYEHIFIPILRDIQYIETDAFNGALSSKLHRTKFNELGLITLNSPPGRKATRYAYSGDTTTITHDDFLDVTETTVKNNPYKYTTKISADGVEDHEVVTELYNGSSGIKWLPKSELNKTTGVLTTFEYDRNEDGSYSVTSETGATKSNSKLEVMEEYSKQGYLIKKETSTNAGVLSSLTLSDPTLWGEPTTMTDSVTGEVSSVVFDEDSRLVIELIDTEGDKITFGRDKYSGVTKKITTPSSVETIEYTASTQTRKLTIPGIPERSIISQFDDLGRVYKTTNNGSVLSTHTILDANGSYEIEIAGRKTTFTLDENGELMKTSGNTEQEVIYTRELSEFGVSEISMTAGVMREEQVFDPYGRIIKVISDRSTGIKDISSYAYSWDANSNEYKVRIDKPDGSKALTTRRSGHTYDVSTWIGRDKNNNGIRDDGENFQYYALSTGYGPTGGASIENSSIRPLIPGDESTTSFSSYAVEIATGNSVKYLPSGTKVVSIINKENNTVTVTKYSEEEVLLETRVKEYDDNNLLKKTTVTFAKSGNVIVTDLERKSDGKIHRHKTQLDGVSFEVNVNDKGAAIGNVISSSNSISISENTIDENGDSILTLVDSEGSMTVKESADGTRVEKTGSKIIDQVTQLSLTAEGTQVQHSYLDGINKTLNYKGNFDGTLRKFTNTSGKTTKFDVGPNGLLKSQTDSRGLKVDYAYDDRGSLASINYPGLTSGHSSALHVYTSNIDGTVKTIEDPSGKRSFTWDRDNVSEEAYTEGALSGYKIVRTFDDDGRLSLTKLMNGNNTVNKASYTYGDGNSLIKSVSSSDVNAAYTYSGFIKGVATIDRNGIVQTYNRDNLGKINSATTNVNGVSNYTIQYDTAMRIDSIQDNQGTWNYDYDDLGQLLKADHPDIDFHYKMNESGERDSYGSLNDSEYIIGNDNANRPIVLHQPTSYSLRLSAVADARLWVNGLEVTNPGVPFRHTVDTTTLYPDGSYIPYEVVGIVEGAGDEGAHEDAVSLFKGFAYSPPGTNTYTYDAAGCRQSSKAWNYEYDARKNLVSMHTRQYHTDNDLPGKLIYFSYNDEGKRYKKVVIERTIPPVGAPVTNSSTIWYLYDGWSLIYERVEPGIADVIGTNPATLERFYTWGADMNGLAAGIGDTSGLLSYREVSDNISNTYIPIYDILGNVTNLVRKNDNTVVATYRYGPYGEIISSTGEKADSNPWKYASKYQDLETGLYYYGHRYYEPVLGVWLSPEPIGQLGGFNLYAYAKNDPINNTDFKGLAPVSNQKAIELERAISKQLIDIYKHEANFSKLTESQKDDTFYAVNSRRTRFHKHHQVLKEQLALYQLELKEGRAAIDALRADAKNAEEQYKADSWRHTNRNGDQIIVTNPFSKTGQKIVKTMAAAFTDSALNTGYQTLRFGGVVALWTGNQTIGRASGRYDSEMNYGEHFPTEFRPVRDHQLWELHDMELYSSASQLYDISFGIATAALPASWGAKANIGRQIGYKVKIFESLPANKISRRASKVNEVTPIATKTGAFNPSSKLTGDGLGKLAGKEIRVSEKGINLVEDHLKQFGPHKQNSDMIARLRAAQQSGQKVSGADASFYLHEAAEATMMRRGMLYDAAHDAALKKYNVSPFSVYHPEVIQANPTLFNSNWRSFWGVGQ